MQCVVYCSLCIAASAMHEPQCMIHLVDCGGAAVGIEAPQYLPCYTVPMLSGYLGQSYCRTNSPELTVKLLVDLQQYTCALFFTACNIFLLYLDDVMHAFEKVRGLVIQGWYFSGRMEINSMGENGNKRKECQNIHGNQDSNGSSKIRDEKGDFDQRLE